MTESSGSAQVAHLAEQSMQRGLVDDRAMDNERVAVGIERQAQAVKPLRPAGPDGP